MKRVDGFLSRKAQAVWPCALVYCDEQTPQVWMLVRPTVEDVGLGASFHDAKQALDAIMNAAKARGKA